MSAVLTARELNRALLARQLLLAGTDRGVVPTVEHLIGESRGGPAKTLTISKCLS